MKLRELLDLVDSGHIFHFVDTETSGSSPASSRVIELATVSLRHGEVVGRFETLIDAGVPVPSWITRLTGITARMLVGAPVPLDASNPAKTTVEGFTYAGGLVITSASTSRLHGLSDLAVGANGQLMAITDEGDLFEAKIQLDAAGRLVGREHHSPAAFVADQDERGIKRRRVRGHRPPEPVRGPARQE